MHTYNLLNQQDGALRAQTWGDFGPDPSGYEQSHDVSWNQQIRELRSYPQGQGSFRAESSVSILALRPAITRNSRAAHHQGFAAVQPQGS